MSLFPRNRVVDSQARKERYDALPAQTSSTISSCAHRTYELPDQFNRVQPPRWRRLFRPCTLAFTGLAIAVFLWGLSYKLSLYQSDRSPVSRLAIAKLWIEPRHHVIRPAQTMRPGAAIAHPPADVAPYVRQLTPTPLGSPPGGLYPLRRPGYHRLTSPRTLSACGRLSARIILAVSSAISVFAR